MKPFTSDVNPFVSKIMDFKNCLFDEDEARNYLGKWGAFFTRDEKAVNLDIGCGNGEYLFHIASNNKNKIYLGIELQYKEIYRACKRISKLDNVRLIMMKAQEVPACFKEGELGDISILFPDPWPKRKQAKHRLLNKEYLLKLFKLMRAGSKLIIKTDNNNYFKEIYDAVFNLKGLLNYKVLEFSRDLYFSDSFDYIKYKTSFERIFLSQGLAINYLVFGETIIARDKFFTEVQIMVLKKQFLILSTLVSVIMFGCMLSKNRIVEDNDILSSEKDIKRFTIDEREGSVKKGTVEVSIACSKSVLSLSPVITVSLGATISPASGEAQDFTSPATYKVTAADGTRKEYIVTVSVAQSSEKEISSFAINGVSGVIDEYEIEIKMAYGVNPYGLTPTIAFVGSSISPASGVAQDFTSPVEYIVIAADDSTREYTVTVNVALSDEKSIRSFTIADQITSVIDEEEGEIEIEMAYGSTLTSLTPTIAFVGSSISPASGVAQNFTNLVTYTVTAADDTAREYTVAVRASLTPLVGDKETYTADGVSFCMTYVPGELSFPTGIENTGTVTVADAYWIGETEITYELWYTVREWAEEHGYTFANAGREGNDGTNGAAPTGALNEPVTYISWRDVIVFSNAITEWYNANNGTNYTCAYYEDPGYLNPIKTTDAVGTPGSQDAPYVKVNARGFRLLTKDEWELAARYKGSNSSNGAIEVPASSGKFWTPGKYASGATADYNNVDATKAVAWYNVNSENRTNTVKTKTPNLLGLYDMGGNVHEWNFDWYLGEEGSKPVIRGGSYNVTATGIRVGYYIGYGPCMVSDKVGVRLGKSY